MLDGRVLEASQVEYKPFGKPPLKREAQRLQSLHAARKGLPHRRHVVQLQAPAVSPQPHSARLPFCAARVFCLSAAPGTSRFAFSSFRKISCAKPGAGPGTPAQRPHWCSSGSSWILVPRLRVASPPVEHARHADKRKM